MWSVLILTFRVDTRSSNSLSDVLFSTLRESWYYHKNHSLVEWKVLLNFGLVLYISLSLRNSPILVAFHLCMITQDVSRVGKGTSLKGLTRCHVTSSSYFVVRTTPLFRQSQVPMVLGLLLFIIFLRFLDVIQDEDNKTRI